MIPKSYHIQNGCWICQHVHHIDNTDIGDGESFYCDFDKQGACSIKEYHKWLRNNEVSAHGICDKYKPCAL